MNRKLKIALRRRPSEQGFAIPIVLGLGLFMILMGATMVVRSQGDQVTASAQKRTGQSLAVAEAGIARTLSQLVRPNNRVLLTQSYDPINPSTKKTYLGSDGIPNTDDEENTEVNQWTTAGAGGGTGAAGAGAGAAPCASAATSAGATGAAGAASAASGTPDKPDKIDSFKGEIGSSDRQYTLRAYRYNATSKTGTLLVDGKDTNALTRLQVTVPITQVSGSGSDNFPGVIAFNEMVLANGNVLGGNGNVYCNPEKCELPPGASKPPTKADLLKALDAKNNGTVEGDITLCKLTPSLSNKVPPGVSPTYTDKIDLSGNTVKDNMKGKAGGITYYTTTDPLTLDGGSELRIDTTAGPVYFYVDEEITLKGNSKFVNYRTDGKPPQVGDLRIFIKDGKQFQSNGNSCLDTAFVYSPNGNLQMGGAGGCPDDTNPKKNIKANIKGVVWVRDWSDSSSNNAGVAVPEDVSSLADLADSLGLPDTNTSTNKLAPISNWQRQVSTP